MSHVLGSKYTLPGTVLALKKTSLGYANYDAEAAKPINLRRLIFHLFVVLCFFAIVEHFILKDFNGNTGILYIPFDCPAVQN